MSNDEMQKTWKRGGTGHKRRDKRTGLKIWVV